MILKLSLEGTLLLNLNPKEREEYRLGIDLAIVLAHQQQAIELMTLPEKVKASTGMNHSAEVLWKVMNQRWSNLGSREAFSSFVPDETLSKSEILERWKNQQSVSFCWAGFSLYFGIHAVYGVHYEKISGFIYDLDNLQTPLKHCSQELAKILSSPLIIYGPDSSSLFENALEVESGHTLEDIVSIAKKYCGSPAETISQMAIAYEGDFDKNCYFIEPL